MSEKSDVTLKTGSFGSMKLGNGLRENEVTWFRWETPTKLSVQVITYGATVTSIIAPDKTGNLIDVVMGFSNIEGYQSPFNNCYLGATIGRVANRTAKGIFSIGSETFKLNINAGSKHHLHGGIIGFDKVNWDYFIDGSKVILSYLSPDGDEKYPGSLLVQVIYEVTADNVLRIEMKCTTTKPTPVNLTNHSYFNLAGHNSGAGEVYQHTVTINSDKYTPLNEDLITTGEFTHVGDTLYDFRVPKLLKSVMAEVGNGYDNNFCITRGEDQGLTFVSRVLHPSSGRIMEVYSNQNGVQFYTGNFLPINDNQLVGKNNSSYKRQGSFCLETQNYPNAVNHKHFPNSILNPGEEYNHIVEYRFGVVRG